ncbi:hypothetical protein FNV43_RR00842 [Rhamnella rubrinervis]|uniref:F-box domain-containing protein n=1 Tax=Rhamnella rubrinervis TaxID=2594499 RepID=A0A8K0HNR3_9ROSA|nr:hypothetical protein FNV43_RR00842 [Rhamnella rubrinervis]
MDDERMENWIGSCSGKREKITGERVENWIATPRRTPRKRLEITSGVMEEDRKKGRREKKHTTTTSAVDVILKDVMDHILGKLPLRNLVRFKCVCKAWNNSITRIAKSTHGPRKIIVSPHDSNPYTCLKIVDIDAVVAASSNTETYSDSESEEIIQEIKFHINLPYKLVGSCNGLLFIEFFTGKKGRKKGKWNIYFLWNPLIKKFTLLSFLPPSNNMLDFRSMIGFGHDGCSDDYKVVRIFAYKDSSFEALVFSLKTGSLRYSKLEQPFSNNTIYKFLKYVPSMGNLVNGALYWAVSDFDYRDRSPNDESDWFEDHFNRTDRSHRLRFRILRFDLADEKFSWMQAPLYVDPQFNLRLMVFKGKKLCAYQTDRVIKMWVLEGDKGIEKDELWAEFMRIPFYQGRIGPERNFAPLAFMRDGRVLVCKNDVIADCRLYNGVHFEKLKKGLGFEGWYYEHFTYEETIESFDRYNWVKMDDQVFEAMSKLPSFKNVFVEMSQEVAKLRAKVKELEKANAAQSRYALDSMRAELRKTKAELDLARAELRNAPSNTELRNAKAELHLVKAELRSAPSHDELRRAWAELDSVRDELAYTQAELKRSSDTQLMKAHDELESVRAELKRALYAELRKAQAELDSKSAELKKAQDELRRAPDTEFKKAQAQAELDSVRAKLRKSQAELDSLSAELKKGHAELKKVNDSDFKKVQRELDSVRAELKKTQAELKKAPDTELKRVQTELNSVRAELRKAQAELRKAPDAELKNALAELDTVRGKLKKAEAELKKPPGKRELSNADVMERVAVSAAFVLLGVRILTYF